MCEGGCVAVGTMQRARLYDRKDVEFLPFCCRSCLGVEVFFVHYSMSILLRSSTCFVLRGNLSHCLAALALRRLFGGPLNKNSFSLGLLKIVLFSFHRTYFLFIFRLKK